MREISVATVQMKPELGNAENNLVKMSDYISTIAAQQKVDLIVFPELITSGYELGVQFTELAQRVPGPAVNLMAQRAADVGVYIAFGMPTKEKVESIIYNSAVLVGPEGELAGVYHKVHLRGEERMAFREGFKMPVFDTGEIGRVGLLVGWDLAFPEVARTMTLEGAELLCVVGNWEADYIDEWKTYIRARAYENSLFVAAANRVGEDVTMNFGGESMIVGPRGKLHAYLEAAEPEVRKQLELELKKVLEADTKKDADDKDKDRKDRDDKAASEAKKDADEKRDGDKKDADKKDKDDKHTPEAKKDADDKDKKAELDAKVLAVQPTKKGELKQEFKKLATAEGYCVARIDLDEVRRFREEFQTLQSRQPTSYKPIVKRY